MEATMWRTSILLSLHWRLLLDSPTPRFQSAASAFRFKRTRARPSRCDSVTTRWVSGAQMWSSGCECRREKPVPQ